MFMELLPLLKQRVVMITVSDAGDGVLRVNVIPRKLDGDADQNQALTTPLSITGSAEELDRELPDNSRPSRSPSSRPDRTWES
jgi:PRTRC genetic system protein E